MRPAPKVARQGCCAWRSRGPGARDERDAEPASGIAGIRAAGRGAGGPDEARLADIACVRTRQGRPYPAMVMGIWSRGVVGWPTSARMATGLADGAPKMAMARRRPPEGRARHPGHGPQHASPRLGGAMRGAGTAPSMGSISPPRGDAATGSLMGPIRAGCAHARTFGARGQAALGIFGYTERLYNRRRIHSAPGHLGPEELERANRPGEGRRPMAA